MESTTLSCTGKDIILTKAAKTVMHEAVASALMKMRNDGS